LVPWRCQELDPVELVPAMAIFGRKYVVPSGYVKIAIENHHFQWENPP
jgi:hypothetical protein